jgi:hypothetical protein
MGLSVFPAFSLLLRFGPQKIYAILSIKQNGFTEGRVFLLLLLLFMGLIVFS